MIINYVTRKKCYLIYKNSCTYLDMDVGIFEAKSIVFAIHFLSLIQKFDWVAYFFNLNEEKTAEYCNIIIIIQKNESDFCSILLLKNKLLDNK